MLSLWLPDTMVLRVKSHCGQISLNFISLGFNSVMMLMINENKKICQKRLKSCLFCVGALYCQKPSIVYAINETSICFD